MPLDPCTCSRRGFGRHALGCGAFVMAALAAAPVATRRAFAAAPAAAPVATTPFARVETVAEGVWAVVSTPFGTDGQRGDRTTLSNGGIIAGKDAVLAVEGFNTPAGADWLAEIAKGLTGRRPTHVVATHYHFDHVGGLAGYQRGAEGPEVLATARTRDLVVSRYGSGRAEEGKPFKRVAQRLVLPTLVLPEDGALSSLDLGGRTVRLRQASGHTDSDVLVDVPDAGVTFGGDLLWNGIFPNFMDATPSRWNEAVAQALADGKTTIVPGHGAVARAADLKPYQDLLALVERVARDGHKAGKPAEEAAKDFTIPASLGPWTLFSQAFPAGAMAAWYKELG